ncbi:unnamed protein product, partial [Polarella glacialis]
MPSMLFAVEQVMYGAAPFSKVRIGYNSSAGCLNLLVPGSTRGAIPLVAGLGTPQGPKVCLDGATCSIGAVVKASFSDEAMAAKFAACLGFDVKELTAPATPPRPRVAA